MITMEEKVNMSSSPINHVLELKIATISLEQVSFKYSSPKWSVYTSKTEFTQFASFVILST